MTFVAAVTSRHSIWMVADRRLSRAGRPLIEDARKILVLETTDGLALLGYAGLGATPAGTQPSEWMSRILRGRNWPLEPSLGAIAEGMKLRLPKHLKGVPDGYVVIAPAFHGKRTKLYSIDIAADRFGRQNGFRYTRWNTDPVADQPPRFAFTGSGSLHIDRRDWGRPLLRLLNAHDRKRITALVVADELARLANRVHERDSFTGKRSVVVWRYAKHGRHKGGGGIQSYDGTSRTSDGCFLPHIAHGMDLAALVQTMLPFTQPRLVALLRGEPDPGEDINALNAALAGIPDQPDDTLD